MIPNDIQTLVLRAPEKPAVAHLIVRIPGGRGRDAAAVLAAICPSFGLEHLNDTRLSVGFSFAGLEAIGVPDAYLRLFRLLAPAYAAGAVLRSAHLGDVGASSSSRWKRPFGHDRAHVLLSWHGEIDRTRDSAMEFSRRWQAALAGEDCYTSYFDASEPCRHNDEVLCGARLGRPSGQVGEWVHFGFRDGISEIRIDSATPGSTAPDCRDHAPGALLLGHINDAGFNPFALSQTPDKVRAFFRESSFGVLRPMSQDLTAFEDQVNRWAAALPPQIAKEHRRDLVKAKLCGRWPNGMPVRPGAHEPPNGTQPESLRLKLDDDEAGTGCPFGSHVRRMRAAPDETGFVYERPLQRRSVPFGPAAWSDKPRDDEPRGHIGHFFCASIEDQFEHLVGQWGAHAPLTSSSTDTALDPFIGPRGDRTALEVPLVELPTQLLHGFEPWTTTLGTMYAWHPSRIAWQTLLKDDFVPEKYDRPWL